jgi:hypothetical protein
MRNLLVLVLTVCWLCAVAKAHPLWPGAVGGVLGALLGRQPAVYDRAEGVMRWMGSMAGGFIAAVLAIEWFTNCLDSRAAVGWAIPFSLVGGTLVEFMLRKEDPLVPRGPWLHRRTDR